jgi:hypothetical protein
MTDYGDEEPVAAWEAAFLPDWHWEAYEMVDETDTVYFGRVKSPYTHGRWEYGYFSQDQLEEAGAYRTDVDPDSDAPLFPDGGLAEEIARLYEVEFEALQYFDPDDDPAGGQRD